MFKDLLLQIVVGLVSGIVLYLMRRLYDYVRRRYKKT